MEVRLSPHSVYINTPPPYLEEYRIPCINFMRVITREAFLRLESFFLAVNIFDRVLAKGLDGLNGTRKHALACLLVAAKYVERNPFSNIPAYIHLAQSKGVSVGNDDFKACERKVLAMVHFDLGWPTPLAFLKRYLKVEDHGIQTRIVATYLLEIMVSSHSFLRHLPSVQAATALHFSRCIEGKHQW
ncbi:G2/mitotic-specific cyclin, partial [Lunasporangiospora selenospora]